MVPASNLTTIPTKLALIDAWIQQNNQNRKASKKLILHGMGFLNSGRGGARYESAQERDFFMWESFKKITSYKSHSNCKNNSIKIWEWGHLFKKIKI